MAAVAASASSNVLNNGSFVGAICTQFNEITACHVCYTVRTTDD
jgi:hypothetical protein